MDRPRDAGRVTRSELRVRFCETDLMGIVHHAEYVRYFEVGRVDWLREAGVLYGDWEKRGIHLPVIDAELQYKRPARFDDVLTLETRVLERTRVTVRFGYRIFGPSGDLLTTGSTRLACVDHSMSPRPFPPDVIATLDA